MAAMFTLNIFCHKLRNECVYVCGGGVYKVTVNGL